MIQSKDNKFYCYDRFSVKSIAYNEDREISALVVENDKGQTVYELKPKAASGNKGKAASKATQTQKEPQSQKEPQKNTITKDQMTSLQAELNRTGVAMETVQSRYKIQEPKAMSEELYEKVMLALSRTKSKAA